jgi:hypothetical protein
MKKHVKKCTHGLTFSRIQLGVMSAFYIHEYCNYVHVLPYGGRLTINAVC